MQKVDRNDQTTDEGVLSADVLCFHRVSEECPCAVQTSLIKWPVVSPTHTDKYTGLPPKCDTHPDHTPDVVSLQLTLLRIRSRFQ